MREKREAGRHEEIFHRAAELRGSERRRFLAFACGDDAELRDEILGLLEADEGPAGAGTAGEADDRGAWAGRRVGNYRLIRRLGRGGMGSVYLAVRDDDAFEKKVAVKLLSTGRASPDLERRLKAERQILAALEHPNIARLLDGGTAEDGSPYLVMDLVEGEPIDLYCDRRQLSLDARLDLFVRVCEAVQVAHRNLVVHRDLKPDNILVTSDGEPRLLDFGVSRLLNPAFGPQGAEPTETLSRFLTLGYASPEQLHGGPLTTAIDVYALGVLLYRLLSGAPPRRLDALPLAEAVRQICEEDPEPPSVAARALGRTKRGRALRGDLDRIVLKALHRLPEERYASVEHLSDDLTRYQRGEPVQAAPSSLLYRGAKLLRRNRVAASVGALLLAGGLLAGAGTLAQNRRLSQALDAAEQAGRRADSTTLFLVNLFAQSARVEPGQALETVSALDVLNRGAARLEGMAGGDPLTRASLANALGLAYILHGENSKATELLESALEARRRELPPGHDDLARSLNDLANAYLADLRLDRAESCYREALEIAQEYQEPNSHHLGRIRCNLAIVLDSQGHYAEAEEQLEEGIAILREVYGDYDLNLAQAIDNLAAVQIRRGHYRQAEASLAEALEIRRRGQSSPQGWMKAFTLSHLAELHHEQGRHQAAEELAEESLATLKKTLGLGHAYVQSTAQLTARIRLSNGQSDAAEDLLERLLALQRQSFGPLHPTTAKTRALLAEVHLRRGFWDSAAEAAAQAGQVLSTRLGATHPDLGRNLFLEARIAAALQQTERARETAAEAQSILVAALPAEHPRLQEIATFLDDLPRS